MRSWLLVSTMTFLKPAFDQPLPQHVRVGDLELKERLVLRRSFELGDYCLRRADEDMQGLELRRVPVCDQEHRRLVSSPDHLT